MSIIIKGMGMPRHCEDCLFLDFSGDYPYCVATGTQKGYTFIPKLMTERMDSCPLVEIPLHGDLIDRDVVKKFPIRRDHYDREHGNPHFINGIETVMEYIDWIPAIIEGEVKE